MNHWQLWGWTGGCLFGLVQASVVGATDACSGLYSAITSTGNTSAVQDCTARMPSDIQSISNEAERLTRLREYRRACIRGVSATYERAVYEVNCERDCAESDRDDARSCAIINANAIKGQLLAMGVPLSDINAIKQETTGGLGTPENDAEWWAYYRGLSARLVEGSAPTAPRVVSRNNRPSDSSCRAYIQRFEQVNEGSSCRTPKRISHLTFDDGPDTETTPIALDTLQEKGVSATFFVMGERLAASDPENPSATVEGRLRLVQRMMREGHVIGSHSWHHDAHTELDASTIERYVARSRRAGVGVRVDGRLMPEYLSAVYRLPYGAGFSGSSVRSDIAENFEAAGFQRHLYWNIDTDDWRRVNREDPNVTRDHLLRELCRTGGGVILMHDIQPTTVLNLGEWIDAIRCNGYELGDYESAVGPVPIFPNGRTIGAAEPTGTVRSTDGMSSERESPPEVDGVRVRTVPRVPHTRSTGAE